MTPRTSSDEHLSLHRASTTPATRGGCIASRIGALDAAVRRCLAAGDIGKARSVRWHVHQAEGSATLRCEDLLDALLRVADDWFGTPRMIRHPTPATETACPAALVMWASGQSGVLSVSTGKGPSAMSLTLLCSKGTLAHLASLPEESASDV